MSRKGKLPIPLPKGVEAKYEGGAVSVKGPKGTLELTIPESIDLTVDAENIVVAVKPQAKEGPAWHGLYRTLLFNLVKGVAEGFEKQLEMIGVGYRAAVKGQNLDLQVGFSHPTELPIPEGIEVKVEKNTKIIISGADKQVVGQFAADIRQVRPPEPYKGKGIRYVNEYVRKKAGKAAASAK